MRCGEDLKIPLTSIQGPQAMLIDETAGSAATCHEDRFTEPLACPDRGP